MNTYKIILMEKVQVIYQVDSENEEQALLKARIGDAKFVDAILLGEPDETFKIELLDSTKEV